MHDVSRDVLIKQLDLLKFKCISRQHIVLLRRLLDFIRSCIVV